MNVEGEHRPRIARDVRTCRQGRQGSGGKGAYPDRNGEACTEGRHDLGHDLMKTAG